jgi:hypothetical protein
VDEVFERRVDRCVDLAYLLDVSSRASTSWEKPTSPGIWPFPRADIALGTGMQLNRRQVHLQQAHVLHDQRIDAGFVQLPDLLARRFQLSIMQDGIERNEDARTVAVGKLHQAEISSMVLLALWRAPKAGPPM